MGVRSAPSGFLKVSLSVSLSVFLRMQPQFLHKTRKWSVLNSPVCLTRVRLRITHRTAQFFCWTPSSNQTNTPLHASYPQTREKGGGWTTPSLQTSPPSPSHKHTCTFSLLPGYTVSFWESRIWVLSVSCETTPHRWLEKWLWQYLNRNYDCLC